ncbi:MAG: PAS domain-containing protein [Betaproteobacteria bacterium]|nr:PAS domain-containing protein [Betaproteobacteria bacterium]
MSAASEEAQFGQLLQFLQRDRGFDFTGYKRPSLMRRVTRRMQMVSVASFGEYVDYLQVHPEEFGQLFNTILINVTTFFRDPPAWEVLKRDVVAPILHEKGPHDPVRIWSAGCASGQEAYSIAILFAEAMGWEPFRERAKVYATDVDEEALAQARSPSYSAKEMEDLDPAQRDRYFELQNTRYVFRSDLRRSVIFGRHDLVQDAPISRLDLLVCRNTLMYFNAETQAQVLSRFHFALNGEGKSEHSYLFLGRAEMMLAHANLFSPVDLKCRIFVKIPTPGAKPRAPAVPAHANGNGGNMATRLHRLQEQALEEAPNARIVIDANGTLALANQRARVLFSLNPKDIGRPLQDLEVSYRPLELRSLIEQAYAGRRSITQTSVERGFPDGDTQYFDVSISPYFDEANAPLGVGITFVDVTRPMKLQEELRRSQEEIQTANEELQSSNEELETTNEELQSSNEELETTNEELQSTNEELETMNEELQSTNEELQTVNEELRQRTDEMNQLNAFLESVLGSLSSGAVVVNQDFNILMWNQRAQDMWGLRADEVQGRSFLNLDIGLPVGDLRGMMRAVYTGEADKREMTLDAVNRRGKKIKCLVSCTPLVTGKKKREGVILLMEEQA